MNKLLFLLLFASFNLFSATFNVSTTPELRQALSDAASNGQDDIIVVADGTYKTTDDGLGTFVYFEQNSMNLIIIGSGNTILSGNNTDQILQSSSGGLFLESLAFTNGLSDSRGGAISHTNAFISISNCIFTSNMAALSGGAIYATASINIYSTTFVNNSASGYAGDWENGGAVFFDGVGTFKNSVFTDNLSTGSLARPGGMSIYADFDSVINIINSLFSSNNTNINSPHITVLRGTINVTNSMFHDSQSNIGLFTESTANIYNSIFYNTLENNLHADDQGMIKIYNSYIDTGLSYGSFILFEQDNLPLDASLLFSDESNFDFRLLNSSDLIDSGTTGVTLPDTDFDGFARIVGGSVDIGPFEFSTTRPTINSVAYIGTAKEQSELTFSVDYALEAGRTIVGISFDYLSDGSFVTTNVHTYNTAGTYTVKTKVLDSEGEFSIASTTVVVVELPYTEMTYEQKLIEAIDPIYYADLTSLIATDKDTAVDAATADGIAIGKQYVQDNLTEFSLVTVADKDSAVSDATTAGIATGKQYVQDNLNEFSLVTVADKDTAVTAAALAAQQAVIDNPVLFGIDAAIPLVKSTIDNLTSGWHSLGTMVEITDLSIFDNAKIVWYFDSNAESWLAYSSNQTTQSAMAASGITTITTISENSGIWVEK